MCDSHLHLNANADPTRTTTLRRKLVRAVNKRFRKLRGEIRERLLANDGPGDPEAFLDWLAQRTRYLIHGDELTVNITESDVPRWMGTVLDQAFTAGAQQAVSKLEAAGYVDLLSAAAIARREAGARRRRAVLTRSLEELTNATGEMRTQIRRQLLDAIDEGISPRDLARRLNNRVDKVGAARARVIARTETIRAHHKAQMAAYEEAQVEGVNVQAEFNTTGDGLVCPECEGLEGQTFTLQEAENLIPVHPNCRCAALPSIPRIADTETDLQSAGVA